MSLVFTSLSEPSQVCEYCEGGKVPSSLQSRRTNGNPHLGVFLGLEMMMYTFGMDPFWFLCLVIVVSIIFILGIFGVDFERLIKTRQEENKRQKGQAERKGITPKLECLVEEILAGQNKNDEFIHPTS